MHTETTRFAFFKSAIRGLVLGKNSSVF